MKTIEMKVKYTDNSYPYEYWIEKYEIANNIKPDVYAMDLINNYNDTLQPYEKARTLVSVHVIEKDKNR